MEISLPTNQAFCPTPFKQTKLTSFSVELDQNCANQIEPKMKNFKALHFKIQLTL
jgi:hypothetical protein